MWTRPRLVATAAAMLLLLAMAAACRPATTPAPMPEGPESPAETPFAAPEPTRPEGLPDAALPPAVLNVRKMLSEQLGGTPGLMTVLEVAAIDWPDSCLGVAGPDEMCAQVITPGYRVVFSVDGNRYVLHSNVQGDVYRVAEGPSGQGVKTTID